MRRLWRPQVQLPTLTGDGRGAREAAKLAAAWPHPPGKKFDFPDHWNELDVRGALRAMQGRVCAYCLCLLPRNDKGDVEHFRPKSLYWWLAYAFENYVLSCSKCNRVCKKDDFPLRTGAPRVEYAQRSGLSEEQRLLMDPLADPVEEWLTLDSALQWQALAQLAGDSLASLRVRKTVQFFRLNTDPDLLQERSDTIDTALLALEKKEWERVRRLASRFHPHGGAVRRVLSNRLELLPTLAQEFEWLLEDMRKEWEKAWSVRTSEDGKKKLEELRWAFAVLWRAPPVGAPATVESWLAQAGLKAEVEPMYKRLLPL